MLPAIPPLIPGSGNYQNLQADYAYLDSIAGELVNTINIWKGTVLAASTTNVQLFGVQTIDSVGLVYGDLVLLKNQTTQKNNGLYVIRDTEWERAPSLINGTNASGIAVYVVQGAQNESKIYVCTNDSGNDIVGSVTDLSFASVANGGTNYQLYYNSNGILSSDTATTDGIGNISATSLTTTGPVVAGSYAKSNNLLFGLNKGIYFNDTLTEIKNGSNSVVMSDSMESNVPVVATRFKLNNVADNTDYSVSYSNTTVSVNISGQSALSLSTTTSILGYLMSPEFSFNNDQDTSLKYTNSSMSFTTGGTVDQLNVYASDIISKVPYIGPNYYTTSLKNYGITSSGTDLNFKTSDVSLVLTDSTKVQSVVPVITDSELNFTNAQIYTTDNSINVSIGTSDILSVGTAQITSNVPIIALNYPFESNTTTGLFHSANTIDFNIDGSNKLKLDTKITSKVSIRVPESTNPTNPSYAFSADTDSGIYKSLSIDKTLTQYPIFNTGTCVSTAVYGTTLALGFTGSVNTYYLQNNSWTFNQSITGILGSSVSLYGNTLAIGDNTNTSIYVNTDDTWSTQQSIAIGKSVCLNQYTQDSLALGSTGFVQMYTRTASTWSTQGPSITDTSLSFGQSVSLYSTTLSIGSSVGTYVYTYNGINWSLQQTINIPGTFVSVYQDTLAICNTTTLYVYIRSVGIWTFSASFDVPDTITSLSMYGNIIAIGTSGYSSNSGRVLVYQYISSQWVYSYYIQNDDIMYQGNYVSVFDHTMVSGGKYAQLNSLNDSVVYTLPSTTRYNVSFSVQGQNALSVFDNSTTTNQLNVSNAISANYYQTSKPFIIGTDIAPLTLSSGLYNLYGSMTVSTECDLFYINDNTTYFITGKTGSTDTYTVIFCTTVYRLNGTGNGTLGTATIGSNTNLSINNSVNPPVLQLTDATDRSYTMTVFVSKF